MNTQQSILSLSHQLNLALAVHSSGAYTVQWFSPGLPFSTVLINVFSPGP